MGVHVLHDLREGKACWYDSVTDTAFGPVFDGIEGDPDYMDGYEEAQGFLEYLHDHAIEPRALAPREVVALHAGWVRERMDANGIERTDA